MKRLFYSVFIFSLITGSCNFSKGVKKDLNTGLTASYNGFSIEDIYLSSGEQRLNNNSIAMGSKVNITATGFQYCTAVMHLYIWLCRGSPM